MIMSIFPKAQSNTVTSDSIDYLIKYKTVIKEEDINPLRTLLISEIMRRSKTPDTSGEDLAKIDLLVLYKTAKELYNNAC